MVCFIVNGMWVVKCVCVCIVCICMGGYMAILLDVLVAFVF